MTRLLPLLVLCAACAGPRHVAPKGEPVDRLLEGFDAPAEDAEWRAGDRVVFSISLTKPEREWFVRITVVSPRDTGIEVEIEILDGEKRPLGTSRRVVPERPLREGFHRSFIELRDAYAKVDVEGAAGAMPVESLKSAAATLKAFLKLFGKTPALNEIRMTILNEVVDRPPLLFLLFRKKHSIGIGLKPDEITQEGEDLIVPISLTLNDKPALEYEMRVAPPHPPYQLAAGVRSIEGGHPTDKSRRFTVRLLSAKRGAPAGH